MKNINIGYIRLIAASFLMILGGITVKATNFDTIVESVLKGDSQLELSRRQTDASVADLKTTNVLADPEIGFEYLRSGSGEEKYNFSVTQSFDWPGLYGARSKQIEIEKAGLLLNNEVERNDRRMRLRAILVDIIAANQAIEQLTSAVEGCEELLAILEKEYERGNVSILDLNKMRISTADYRLKLSDAKTNKDILIGELTAMVEDGSDVIEQCYMMNQFPLIEFKSISEYMEVAMSSDASLLVAKNQLLAAKAGKQVANRSTLPGFSAGYRLSHEGGQLFNGFGVGVSLPLWRASKERKASTASELSAMFGEKAMEIKIEKRIQAIYRNAVNLRESIAQYGKALTVSDNVGLLRRAYDSGAITLTDFVLDFNYFVEANVQFIELQRQYYNVLVELTRYDDQING